MRQQCHAFLPEGLSQFSFGEQPVDSEFHQADRA
jgi:hypothetical protein